MIIRIRDAVKKWAFPYKICTYFRKRLNRCDAARHGTARHGQFLKIFLFFILKERTFGSLLNSRTYISTCTYKVIDGCIPVHGSGVPWTFLSRNPRYPSFWLDTASIGLKKFFFCPIEIVHWTQNQSRSHYRLRVNLYLFQWPASYFSSSNHVSTIV